MGPKAEPNDRMSKVHQYNAVYYIAMLEQPQQWFYKCVKYTF